MSLYDTSDLEEEVTSEVTGIPEEFGMNFDTGQLTGGIVYGAEAVAVWAYNALKQERYKSRLFSWTYGSEHFTLIGERYSREYTKARTKKMLEDCLLQNKHIKGIKDLICSYSDGSCTIKFTLITEYGEEEVNV